MGDKNGNEFSKEAFAGLFPEKMKDIPKKLYDIMQVKSPPPNNIVDWESFLNLAHVLCCSEKILESSEFNNQTKIGFLSQCFFNTHGDQLTYVDVTYYNAFRFLKDLILMFVDLPTVEG